MKRGKLFGLGGLKLGSGGKETGAAPFRGPITFGGVWKTPCDRLKSRERGYFRRSVYPDAERSRSSLPGRQAGEPIGRSLTKAPTATVYGFYPSPINTSPRLGTAYVGSSGSAVSPLTVT
ncbi:hypothetical protein MRX96_057588 [Rhipicephalus microplus]